jgi:hypothetical protein
MSSTAKAKPWPWPQDRWVNRRESINKIIKETRELVI